MHEIQFNVTNEPNPAYVKALEDGLSIFNLKTGGHERDYSYCFAQAGDVLYGGISGSRTGGKFHIRHLWVAEDKREEGIGSSLLSRMEAVAKSKSCTEIFVDTMSFQAPEFYTKHGFSEVARVPEFYTGHDRIFLKKDIC